MSKNATPIYPNSSMEKPILINVVLIKVAFSMNTMTALIKDYLYRDVLKETFCPTIASKLLTYLEVDYEQETF